PDETATVLRRNARALNRLSLIGGAVIGVFIFGFGAWAAVAPLASAAIANGVVSPEGNRRTVQHLEGGIIRELLVKDGAEVKAGDTLLVLDDTRDLAAYDSVRMQRLADITALARLDAEQSGAASITLPQEVLDDAAANPVAAALVRAQQEQFKSRRESILGQKSVLEQRIAQSRADIEGLRAQIVAGDTQLALIQEEINGVAPLVAKGLERKTRLLELQRGQARIAGEKASDVSAIAKAEQIIGESQMRMLALDSDFRDKIAEERATTQKELAQLEEKMRSAGDVVGRTRILAPVDGVVVNLKYHTLGGVIQPGAPILELVPKNDRLVIDVQVQPHDIDTVREGQSALVRFTAYHQRNMPRIDGKVIYVAADSTQDEQTKRSYFLAKVEVDPTLLKQVAPQINLSAGMPAEASIQTGTRTALQYAVDPLVHAFQRSFV
ncbi:HlyD family type I secretion periplasmic adaptor subunit, partial [Inquilinus limosus]|uniref:HlyD family type I secretion periplasmic adaptor subunit n=1 Tax=Inquilinus limosus TaxID=171674 RepID=UPI003F14AD0B